EAMVTEAGAGYTSKKGRNDVRLPNSAYAFLAALLCMGAPVDVAQAQDFPNRSIRLIVAFPAGGPTDFVARLLADKMKASLGQSVLIENKPGANAAIGADFVAKSEPD